MTTVNDTRQLAKFLIALGALDKLEEMKPYPVTEEWEVAHTKALAHFTQLARWYGHNLAGHN